MLDEPRERRTLPPRDLARSLFEPGQDDLAAVLHLERHARWVAEYYPVDRVEELGEGRLAVTLRVGDPRWLVRLALRLGDAAEVVEPAGLRDQVIVMVGGAPVTQEYADAVGADGYAADAATAVRKAKELLAARRATVGV